MARIITRDSFMPPPVEPDMGPVIIKTVSIAKTKVDQKLASIDT